MIRNRVSVLLLITLVIFSFVLSSCGGGVKPVGRWQTELEDEDLGKVSLVYRFTEDGEIFLEQGNADEVPFSIPFGTYSVSGSKMIIVSDGVEKEYTFSVEEEKMILSSEGDPDMIFQRV